MVAVKPRVRKTAARKAAAAKKAKPATKIVSRYSLMTEAESKVAARKFRKRSKSA